MLPVIYPNTILPPVTNWQQWSNEKMVSVKRDGAAEDTTKANIPSSYGVKFSDKPKEPVVKTDSKDKETESPKHEEQKLSYEEERYKALEKYGLREIYLHNQLVNGEKYFTIDSISGPTMPIPYSEAKTYYSEILKYAIPYER